MENKVIDLLKGVFKFQENVCFSLMFQSHFIDLHYHSKSLAPFLECILDDIKDSQIIFHHFMKKYLSSLKEQNQTSDNQQSLMDKINCNFSIFEKTIKKILQNYEFQIFKKNIDISDLIKKYSQRHSQLIFTGNIERILDQQSFSIINLVEIIKFKNKNFDQFRYNETITQQSKQFQQEASNFLIYYKNIAQNIQFLQDKKAEINQKIESYQSNKNCYAILSQDKKANFDEKEGQDFETILRKLLKKNQKIKMTLIDYHNDYEKTKKQGKEFIRYVKQLTYFKPRRSSSCMESSNQETIQDQKILLSQSNGFVKKNVTIKTTKTTSHKKANRSVTELKMRVNNLEPQEQQQTSVNQKAQENNDYVQLPIITFNMQSQSNSNYKVFKNRDNYNVFNKNSGNHQALILYSEQQKQKNKLFLAQRKKLVQFQVKTQKLNLLKNSKNLQSIEQEIKSYYNYNLDIFNNQRICEQIKS